MAMARWVLPVPVPPTSTALRWAAMNPPVASSRTSGSLTGVAAKSKPAISLPPFGRCLRPASGSLAMVISYLIEPACFSVISAVSRSPTTRGAECWRLTASAITSS
jgi:hypothetical protein